MKPDSRFETPDPLAGEDLLSDLGVPAEAEAACGRVRERLFVAPPRVQRRWQVPLAAAAAIVLAIGGLQLPNVLPPVEGPALPAFDADGGFAELRQVGTRLAVLERDCDRLEQDDFWGAPRQKRTTTR